MSKGRRSAEGVGLLLVIHSLGPAPACEECACLCGWVLAETGEQEGGDKAKAASGTEGHDGKAMLFKRLGPCWVCCVVYESCGGRVVILDGVNVKDCKGTKPTTNTTNICICSASSGLSRPG